MPADPTLDLDLAAVARRVPPPRRVHHARLRPLGRDRRGQRRRRRHGRVPARHGRHQGAGAGGGPHGRPPEGIPDDGVALRVSAPAAPSPRPSRARRRRVQLPRSSLRRQPRLCQAQEARLLRGQLVHAQLGGQREAAPDHGHALLVGPGPRAGRQDELLGPRRHPLRAAPVPGRQPRRLRHRLALRLRGAEAVLRQGRRASRGLGDARGAGPGAGRDLPARAQAQLRRGALQGHGREDGTQAHPGARGCHHGRRAGQQVPRALPGPRAMLARVRHRRHVPLPDRAHLPRARQRQVHGAPVLRGRRGVPRPRHRPRGRSARHRREHPRR